jgi:hypothetical protein
MKKINKYIQYIILATIPLCLVSSLIVEGAWFWLLFLPIPLGITQYIGSLVDLLFYGTKSIYRYHLLASTIVLLIAASTTDTFFRLDGIIQDIATFIGFAGSFALADYFWLITFSPDEPLLEEEHNVYDL